MAIQIGKYKRPGIFIEEFDNSVITTPTVTGISTLVVGFSKKGPINTPVLLQNTTDLQNIFGSIDSNMERKGSYFHRTVAQMLQSSPVYAMNLLSTSDVLDTIQYKSVSTSTDKINDVERDGAYRRFFDTTGFWKRDTDSFINLTKNDEGSSNRLLSFTNMSDKYITVFVFKSKLGGFDQTLLTWYGSADKVPAYLSQYDYASDYLVDVIVVGGDWSNYQQLAVDNIWSQYFTSQGLIKEQVYNFANDRNVNLLNFYEGLSLIPFFRDSNGKNIFIETIVNADTDSTGLFCYFDADKFEKDFPTGMVDLIGNNLVSSNQLVDNGQIEIDFLSYKASIIEELSFSVKPLDLAGGLEGQNLVAIGPSVSNVRDEWGDIKRTAFYAESYINGIYATPSIVSSTSSLIIGYDIENVSFGTKTKLPYFVSGGLEVLVNSGTTGTLTYSIPASLYPVNASIANYTSVFHLDASTGDVVETNGSANGVYPNIPTSDLVLGYANFNIRNGVILQNPISILTINDIGSATSSITLLIGSSSYTYGRTASDTTNAILASHIAAGLNISGYTASVSSSVITITDLNTNLYSLTASTTNNLGATVNTQFSMVGPVYTNVGVTGSGYNELSSGSDYTVSDLGSGKIKVTFVGTSKVDVTNDYLSHRKIRLFNFLVGMLDSPNLSEMTMIKDVTTREKLSLVNASISNIVTSTTSDKSFTLDLGVSTTPTDIANGNLVFYKLDNEFVLGTDGVNTTSLKGTGTYGIVAQYSDLYSAFYNGQINSGDYFYHNINNANSGSPLNMRVVLQNTGTQSYIVFGPGDGMTPWTPFYGNEQILLPDSSLNTGVITLSDGTDYHSSLIDPSTGLAYSATYSAYLVSNNLVDEDLSDISTIYDSTNKIYLQMYLDSSNNLKIKFVDDTFTAINPVDVLTDSVITVITDKSNYKQSIDIEVPTGYTPVVNKILVNGSRYTEVKIGDFLEAYVDPNITLEVGEVPRKLTRILTKRTYANDTTLVEITCDSAIEKYEISSGTYQSMRYTSIDDYVSTYQAIPLKGFRVRQDSMPDGTETRQSAILNLIAKGTPLFKALTNKEAIDFRYVTDSFGLGLIERSKQQLVDVCGDRLDCLGFLNMPSMKSFKNSSSPYFVDSDGVLQTSYIATGGDLASSPAFLYSFGDGRGTTCVGYFLPYVTVSDNGRPTDVPPAMFVATTYMRKQNTNVTSIVPWTIAAGVTNGRVTNIAGIEMNFTPTDIENLNGAQMNPIVYKRNRGFVIETENTAQTLYKSALSYLHVREVLIELERQLSAMLLEFQWKFNTAEIRAEIKLRADVICETFVNKNGLYNYFNKCDEENNTPTIIDNQIGVLDTYVEPIKGMGIIVNNITILRTGAISAGGFMNG